MPSNVSTYFSLPFPPLGLLPTNDTAPPRGPPEPCWPRHLSAKLDNCIRAISSSQAITSTASSRKNDDSTETDARGLAASGLRHLRQSICAANDSKDAKSLTMLSLYMDHSRFELSISKPAWLAAGLIAMTRKAQGRERMSDAIPLVVAALPSSDCQVEIGDFRRRQGSQIGFSCAPQLPRSDAKEIDYRVGDFSEGRVAAACTEMSGPVRSKSTFLMATDDGRALKQSSIGVVKAFHDASWLEANSAEPCRIGDDTHR